MPARLAGVREAIERARQRAACAKSELMVGVQKTHGPEARVAAWEAGLRDVGENRVQEAIEKMARVAMPVRWHMIGHLQRNKVKQLDGFHLVHWMASPRVADALSAHGLSRGRSMDVLVQVNVSGEGTKGGYEPTGLEREVERLHALSGLVVRGVMTMAPFGASDATLREVFGGARRCGELLRAAGHPATELSMGMSGDYEIAVEEGAT